MSAIKRVAIERAEELRLENQAKRTRAIAEQKARAYRSAIAGAERQRELMGDSWADATIAHYRELLRAMGEQV
ncbi:MAG TPA: hypothetical protein VJR90_00050 [Gammaproteobacteria bacterium]|jgi:hypothetical protein|nr:hypothetical protein [Gammaproteobacteria bacterium]